MSLQPQAPAISRELSAGPNPVESANTREFLRRIGVPYFPPRVSPFDPGYDPVTLRAHLEQSAHLYSSLKISMACWMVASENCTREKTAAARSYGVPVVTGGGPFEIAVAQGALQEYMDLCASIGANRIECGEGFTTLPLTPRKIVQMANERCLEVQFELGKKHEGSFLDEAVDGLIEQGNEWLEAGSVHLIVEARESGKNIGLFDSEGSLNFHSADRFAEAFGLEHLVFEAPNKPCQFALLDHFGPGVHLGNVRLEEVLRVEIYRRGLHSDAFGNPKLRPSKPETRNVTSPLIGEPR
jgi:phosphosulfolactate synthase